MNKTYQNTQVFEFFGNEDLRYPPHEVQAKGSGEILRYFRQILDCPKSGMMLIDAFDLAEIDHVIFRYLDLTCLDVSKNNLMKVCAFRCVRVACMYVYVCVHIHANARMHVWVRTYIHT